MPETTTTELTAIEAVRDQNLSLVDLAGRVEVIDPTSADRAGRLLTQINAVVTGIEEARKKITRPLDDAKKAAMEQAKDAKSPFVEAADHLKGEILGWNIRERDRIARERAEAEAEQARLENEAQRAAEEGRLDDAASLQIQRDMTGTTEKVHRAAGTQARFTWVGEVTNLSELILAVASGDAPVGLLQVDQSALNAFARATGGKAPIPGVRFFQRAGLASTARA